MSNPTIFDYYKYSVLATAAYVRMGGKPLTGAQFSIEADTQDGGRLPFPEGQYWFNPSQAVPNSSPWTILNYYGGDIPAGQDPIASSDKTGFAATLFQRTENGNVEKVLAIRGTEPKADGYVDVLQADLSAIGILGISFPQAISMVNLIMRLRADVGNAVAQYRIETSFQRRSSSSVLVQSTLGISNPVYIDLVRTTDAVGLGAIGPNDKVVLTGHSLGGHLAVLAARLFPNLFDPQVFTYNAPGFDPTTADNPLVPSGPASAGDPPALPGWQ